VSAGAKRGGTGDRALLRRGLAGGVRREVRPEERAALAALKPDAQTQAVLDTLPTVPAADGGAEQGRISSGVTAQPSDLAHSPTAVASAAEETGVSRPIELVAIAAVVPSPHQARRHFAGIAELARSIADTGLQHPILVRRNATGAAAGYTLVFGERRHRAYAHLAREGGAAP
jgi:hypothetical protein